VPNKDAKYKDLAGRIRWILEVMQWSQSDLAREIGASPGAVGHWLLRNQQMDASYAFILQDKHRWNARWILEGIGPSRIEVTDEEAEALFREIMELPADRRRALRTLLGST
jgi:transcriptional regulator with XRE-family HTH domain